jgi:uncharacterized membrane protein YoaK (UPF0700 family)
MSRSDSGAMYPRSHASDEGSAPPRAETRLPTLLSVIGGMVDLIGFLTLGNIFTAHITGNLVVIAAELVRGGPLNLAQALAIPVFILGVAATWLLASAWSRPGPGLTRRLLVIQFLLLAGLLMFSVITNPSGSPHGLMAGIAVMIAVSAMACQFALLRLALPGAPSTAVMTGNLTNTVLALLDSLSRSQPLRGGGTERLGKSLYALIGFLGGCVVAAVAVSLLGDWAWSCPVALAGVAVAWR